VGTAQSTITPEIAQFIAAQPMFFVATAPTSLEGHINLSPKGMNTFRVLSPTRVAYLDLTGSGNETAAHLMDNGRVTFMFCAFGGPPKILRLFGRGKTIQPGTIDWDALADHFEMTAGIRQIIVADVTRVQSSCGFAVPVMNFQRQRDTLVQWAQKKGEEGLRVYRRTKNRRSIDGLPTPEV
jgi:predicted pyridoxine 5'-phosphate oxidase superfamily flavin-nucleotide-binding protein